MSDTSSNLDQTLVRGIAWTGAIRWGAQALSWTSTLLIARLLTPTDFGLVGMAMIYVGMAQIVSEGGVSAAVVQQRDLTDAQIADIANYARASWGNAAPANATAEAVAKLRVAVK